MGVDSPSLDESLSFQPPARVPPKKPTSPKRPGRPPPDDDDGIFDGGPGRAPKREDEAEAPEMEEPEGPAPALPDRDESNE